MATTITGSAGKTNRPPIAADDSFAANEDEILVGPTSYLLSNDKDPDKDSLTIIGFQSQKHGTVVFNGSQVTFTPEKNYAGTASFEYIVSDGRGGTDVGLVSINLRAVDDPPNPITDTNTAPNAVIEGAANGTSVGVKAFTTDPDGSTITISYSFGRDAGGAAILNDGVFAINIATGDITVHDGSKLDYETSASHQVTVRADSGAGPFTTQAFTINVTNNPADDPNRAPTNLVDADASANAVQENLPGFTYTGITAQATDPDGDGLSYWFKRPDGTRDNDVYGFTIDPGTGRVLTDTREPPTNDGVALDYERQQSHQITVYAVDGRGGETSQTFTINVTNDPADDPKVVTFEDLGGGKPIPDGYAGFNWSAIDGGGDVYSAFFVDSVAAYNAFGYRETSVSRSDAADFAFRGVDIGRISDLQNLSVTGYRDGQVVGARSFDLSASGWGSTIHMDANWIVDDVRITADSNNNYIFDNFTYLG